MGLVFFTCPIWLGWRYEEDWTGLIKYLGILSKWAFKDPVVFLFEHRSITPYMNLNFVIGIGMIIGFYCLIAFGIVCGVRKIMQMREAKVDWGDAFEVSMRGSVWALGGFTGLILVWYVVGSIVIAGFKWLFQ